MEAVQIYLLISQVIAAARLQMTVGSEPITSLFTLLHLPIVTATARLWRNKWWKISSLIPGRVKGKADGNRMIISLFCSCQPSGDVLVNRRVRNRTQVC